MMSQYNHLNVYKGSNSVQDYFDPDNGPPYPLVEIPDSLNPFRQDGVRIYAKMMTMHPANNVKAMPALNLLEKAVVPGKTKTVVEYSSGSTVIAMSLVSRAFHGVPDVRAFLSNKTSQAKLRLMQFFGLSITLWGGPSQPEPLDERGGICGAANLAEGSSDTINPNQYDNDNNWKAHVRWTGPQILKQLPEISIICAGMGTSGTMTGLGTFFKENKPSVCRLGVCTAAGDRVPGPRSYSLLGPVKFPWKESVDHIEHVDSYNSYALSLDLCREGLICGPSSGFNLKGLYQFIDKNKETSEFRKLADSDGEIHCVFLCCDLPYQYIEEYFAKLGSEKFPTIQNQNLQNVDLYRYDEAWEKDPSEVLIGLSREHMLEELCTSSTPRRLEDSLLDGLYPRLPNAVVIDLRQKPDFDSLHLAGSYNIPMIDSRDQNPFSDAKVLESLWLKLEAIFQTENDHLMFLNQNQDSPMILVCDNGNSARVATSVLRAKGYEADSIRGGIGAITSLRSIVKIESELSNVGISTEGERMGQRLGVA